jgi:hypothetical protein
MARRINPTVPCVGLKCERCGKGIAVLEVRDGEIVGHEVTRAMTAHLMTCRKYVAEAQMAKERALEIVGTLRAVDE